MAGFRGPKLMEMNVATAVFQEDGFVRFSWWWFQLFCYFHPYLGKISNLANIFQVGWFNHQPDFVVLSSILTRF